MFNKKKKKLNKIIFLFQENYLTESKSPRSAMIETSSVWISSALHY